MQTHTHTHTLTTLTRPINYELRKKKVDSVSESAKQFDTKRQP